MLVFIHPSLPFSRFFLRLRQERFKVGDKTVLFTVTGIIQPIGPQWDLIAFRGFDAGGNLKEVGTTHWNEPNTGATNSSGFTGLPGGSRFSDDGSFYNLGEGGYFWSSSQDNDYFS
ncbi:MAG TPA: FISUMP domain-containing protein [Bacteroidales bacterium]|nr:FISUMP domain-containing protein [Bacteroidales bacterium]